MKFIEDKTNEVKGSLKEIESLKQKEYKNKMK